MSQFCEHTPSRWEFTRGESLEHRIKRETRLQTIANTEQNRSEGQAQWWTDQRYVNQGLPSHFTNPTSFDHFNYGYQLYARQPRQWPIQSLSEATDQIPPLRYNVKRIAIDKPYRSAACAMRCTNYALCQNQAPVNNSLQRDELGCPRLPPLEMRNYVDSSNNKDNNANCGIVGSGTAGKPMKPLKSNPVPVNRERGDNMIGGSTSSLSCSSRGSSTLGLPARKNNNNNNNTNNYNNNNNSSNDMTSFNDNINNNNNQNYNNNNIIISSSPTICKSSVKASHNNNINARFDSLNTYINTDNNNDDTIRIGNLDENLTNTNNNNEHTRPHPLVAVDESVTGLSFVGSGDIDSIIYPCANFCNSQKNAQNSEARYNLGCFSRPNYNLLSPMNGDCQSTTSSATTNYSTIAMAGSSHGQANTPYERSRVGILGNSVCQNSQQQNYKKKRANEYVLDAYPLYDPEAQERISTCGGKPLVATSFVSRQSEDSQEVDGRKIRRFPDNGWVRGVRTSPNVDDEDRAVLCHRIRRCAKNNTRLNAELDAKDPLIYCQVESKQPGYKPKPGYGTYKIIGSRQYREAQEPNIVDNLELPEHLRKFREYQRRCPDVRKSRYDKSNPLYEMLLPSMKVSTLIASNPDPFVFARNTYRNTTNPPPVSFVPDCDRCEDDPGNTNNWPMPLVGAF